MKVSFLPVALERTVFPLVKQYMEDKMAAECCYDLNFRAQAQYDKFSFKQLSYRYLILLNSITLKSN